ncbi:hypothetical protein SLE2022_242820 [Rubroshorea leprosula]
MEGVSTRLYKGLKRYWRRRSYVKLKGSRRIRRNEVELGSSLNGRRRFWRIRIKPKLRLRTPKKFFVWLRDAYVNMMLRLSNSWVMTAGSGYGGVISNGIATFGKEPMKEYDEKMIVEIYKSFVIGQLTPHDAAKLGSAAVPARTI